MSRTTTLQQTLGVITAVALAIGLAGCSQNADDSSDPGSSAGPELSTTEDLTPDESANDTSTQPAADADLRTVEFPITAEDAVQIATDAAGAGFVYSIELDHDDDNSAWEWEIHVLDGTTEHELEIDAVSGDIVSHEQDSTDDTEQAVNLTDPMTYDEALELAVANVDGTLHGWNLDWDDNVLEYEFDLKQGDDDTDVSVNVETGAVRLD
ncbi:MAG: PepSY domain-containing protein [Leucobacter sp.]